MSSLIKFLKDSPIPQITNITDAQYENDPNGTKANAEYFHENVHKYLKHTSAVLMNENTKIVSKIFKIDSQDLGDPFYTSIANAYAGLSNPGPSNKAYIHITNCATEYNETLTFNRDGYVIIDGDSKFGTVLNGSINITNGCHIFRNIKFAMSIQISSGTVLFENCEQVTGSTSITGTSAVIISNCGMWGTITIAESLTNVKLWCENIHNMLKDSNNDSFIIPGTLENPEIVIRRVAAQGKCSDIGNKIKEISGFEPYITARPII